MLGCLDPSNCLMPKSQLLRTGQVTYPECFPLQSSDRYRQTGQYPMIVRKQDDGSGTPAEHQAAGKSER
jgi:hypothetical protein